ALIIGGSFSLYNGTNRSCLAGLNSDGSLDLGFDVGIGFNSGSPTLVDALATQLDGKLLVGGNFEGYNGASAESLVRLNTDGSRDTNFDTRTLNGGGFYTYSVVPQPDGKVLIGGNFAEVKSIGRSCIARLNTNATLDVSFDPGTGAVAPLNLAVHSIILQPDGNVILGGAFTTVDRVGRWNVARVYGDAPVFKAPTFSSGNFGLQWTAISGRTYRVQFRTNLTSGDWTDLLPDIVASTNSVSMADPLTGTNRYYRVILLP
ncbi:MAG TPA: delta-60 repeat domain-containing protein, partial [Verrucomicrobiae bacterium]